MTVEYSLNLTPEEIEMLEVALEEFELSVGQAISSDERGIIKAIREKFSEIAGR